MKELKRYLEERYEFRHNRVTGRICYRRKNEDLFKDFDQTAENNLMVELEEERIHYTPSKLKVLLHSNFSKSYDPLKEYFENLPAWDGVDHVGRLADKVKTDDDTFFRIALEKFLCLAVVNWLGQGAINEYMLILTGGQRIGKSTFASSLVPKELKDYAYQGNMLLNLNDFMKRLAQKAFIILDEFDCVGGRNVPILKELITRREIDTRLAFHKDDYRQRRIASFIGTTNLAAPLHDKTGNRRFLCFRVKHISWEVTINLDQVYSQIFSIVNSNSEIGFSDEELKKINQRNEQFTYLDMIQQAIFDRYRPTDDATANRKTVKEIAKEILPETGWTRIDRPLLTRIGLSLHDMGFKKRKSKGRWYYLVLPLESAKDIYD